MKVGWQKIQRKNHHVGDHGSYRAAEGQAVTCLTRETSRATIRRRFNISIDRIRHLKVECIHGLQEGREKSMMRKLHQEVACRSQALIS